MSSCSPLAYPPPPVILFTSFLSISHSGRVPFWSQGRDCDCLSPQLPEDAKYTMGNQCSWNWWLEITTMFEVRTDWHCHSHEAKFPVIYKKQWRGKRLWSLRQAYWGIASSRMRWLVSEQEACATLCWKRAISGWRFDRIMLWMLCSLVPPI